MKHLITCILVCFSLVFFAKEREDFEVGQELVVNRDNAVVLYHYKHDAIEINLNRDFLEFPAIIDVRHLYKIKKGEKIKIVEILREGKVFRVELLKEKPKRNYYFIELESLKHYNLVRLKNISS